MSNEEEIFIVALFILVVIVAVGGIFIKMFKGL